MALSKSQQLRRKDITREGVAQEALDVLESLAAEGWSSSEAFTSHGYSLSRVCKQALKEENRIREKLLRAKLEDVTSTILSPVDVKMKYSIADFKEPVLEGEKLIR